MSAPVRDRGETRRLIVARLKKAGHPLTWPDIREAVGITAGYRTQKRMLEDDQIRKAGVNVTGVQLYALGR